MECNNNDNDDFCREVDQMVGIAAAARQRRSASLCRIEELETFEPPGHGPLQLRISGADRNLTYELAMEDKEFQRRFLIANPILASFDFAQFGLVLAGPAAAAILTWDDETLARIPVRVFNLHRVYDRTDSLEDEFAQVITAVGDHVAAEAEVDMSRCATSIAFDVYSPWVGAYTVRIELRYYESVGELLSGFALGSDQIVWDGRRIWASELGRFALKHRLNIFNRGVDAADTDTAVRILRAMEHGYAVVLPHAERGPTLKLGHVTFTGIKEHCSCCLYAERGSVPPHPVCLASSIRAINEGKPGAVVSCEYAPGLDVRTVHLRIAVEDFGIKDMLAPTVEYHPRVFALYAGPRLALKFTVVTLTGGSISWDDIYDAVDERNQDLAAGIPFRIASR
jgi:hypothetical protein